LGEAAKSAQNDLKGLLDDQNPDVRITAAEALCNLGQSGVATPVLIEALNEDNLMVRVHALNSLEILGGEVAKAAIPKVKELVGDSEDRGYDIRAGKRLVEIYE
jgi:HEAT repeat protein